jgi:hypothetical protein
MAESDITSVEEFCRHTYNEAVAIREKGYIDSDRTLVPEDVGPDVYLDFKAAYDDALVECVEDYTATLQRAQQRESVTSLVRLQDDEWRTVHAVTEILDGVWRDDASDPYDGLNDTVTAYVDEFADGF